MARCPRRRVLISIVIVRTTPSSYASFQLVAGRLADAPAVITTVDAIMPVEDFQLFVKLRPGFPEKTRSCSA